MPNCSDTCAPAGWRHLHRKCTRPYRTPIDSYGERRCVGTTSERRQQDTIGSIRAGVSLSSIRVDVDAGEEEPGRMQAHDSCWA